MPYQTRPKSHLPLPRSHGIYQPLNVQLSHIYKSMRGSCPLMGRSAHIPVVEAVLMSHQEVDPTATGHIHFPASIRHKTPFPGSHPLPQRVKNKVCIWIGKSWLYTAGQQEEVPGLWNAQLQTSFCPRAHPGMGKQVSLQHRKQKPAFYPSYTAKTCANACHTSHQTLWERKPVMQGRDRQLTHQRCREYQPADASPTPIPPLCQAQAPLAAHHLGWALTPPLPRTSRCQGTYHSTNPRKKQAALTGSTCVWRPLKPFFPLLPSALLWATESNSAALRACTKAATHLSDP